MTEDQRIDLVFEGGGVKGVALVGALEVLEERGFRAQTVAGSSAGALVAVLHAAGYTAGELREILLELDFRSFQDLGLIDRVPLIGKLLSVLLDQGIYEGRALREFAEGLLRAKGVRTFGDLVDPSCAGDALHRYRAQVIASDLTARKLLVLPRDAHTLGIEPDELDVALALRMSTSIPIYFEPVRQRNEQTGEEHVIVDGGVLSNFPVWLFDSHELPRWPTFGLLLVDPEPRRGVAGRVPSAHASGVRALVSYLRSLVATMLEARDRLYLEMADYARTISIDTLGVAAVDFDLERERAEQLLDSGRRAAEEFLASWDFDAYVRAFRTGTPYSRRDELAARMRRMGGEGNSS